MVCILNLKLDWVVYKKLKEIIWEYQLDIVYIYVVKVGVFGRKVVKVCGVLVIVYMYYGYVFYLYFGRVKIVFYKFIECCFGCMLYGIVVIFFIQKVELMEEYCIVLVEKVMVVLFGFDLQCFYDKWFSDWVVVRLEYGLEEKEVVVVIIGCLVLIKNYGFFLDVIVYLVEKGVVVWYFIVGDGSECESICQWVEMFCWQYGLEIEMIFWIIDIVWFNLVVDIICLMFDNEGMLVSFIEVQVFGILVILMDVGGVCDILEEGEIGFVVLKGDFKIFV